MLLALRSDIGQINRLIAAVLLRTITEFVRCTNR